MSLETALGKPKASSFGSTQKELSPTQAIMRKILLLLLLLISATLSGQEEKDESQTEPERALEYPVVRNPLEQAEISRRDALEKLGLKHLKPDAAKAEKEDIEKIYEREMLNLSLEDLKMLQKEYKGYLEQLNDTIPERKRESPPAVTELPSPLRNPLEQAEINRNKALDTLEASIKAGMGREAAVKEKRRIEDEYVKEMLKLSLEDLMRIRKEFEEHLEQLDQEIAGK